MLWSARDIIHIRMYEILFDWDPKGNYIPHTMHSTHSKVKKKKKKKKKKQDSQKALHRTFTFKVLNILVKLKIKKKNHIIVWNTSTMNYRATNSFSFWIIVYCCVCHETLPIHAQELQILVSLFPSTVWIKWYSLNI